MVFHYGRLTRDGGTDPRTLVFACLAVQTTGLDATWGARLCEVAVVRVRGDGTVLDEYATLVNPKKPVGNTEVHGITDTWMVGVSGFEQIAGDLVRYLSDAVVVGYDLPAIERFLAAEFELLGIPVTGLPGLCALQTFRTHLQHPDHRFDSLCWALTGQWPIAERYSLEDARLLAAMVTRLLDLAPEPLGWKGPTSAVPPMLACGGDIAPRAATPRRGTLEDVDVLVERLPAMNDAPPPRADGLANYRMALERYMAQGTVTAEDAEHLALLASRAGLTQQTARDVHQGLRQRVPQSVGATTGPQTGAGRAGLVGGLRGIAIPDVRDMWRPHELTPEEYHARYLELEGQVPADLVIEPPETTVRKKEAQPRRGTKTALFVAILVILGVAWQIMVWTA